MNNVLESSTVEHPILTLLQSMGYQYIDAGSENMQDSCFGRESTKEVLLRKQLLEALGRINSELPQEVICQAIMVLQEVGLNKNTINANKEVYELYKEGVKVKMVNEKGQQEIVNVKIFDFEDVENNDFLVVNQLRIQGDFYSRRPDVLVFVNGIPLFQIELKKPTVSIEKAYEDNLQDYIQTIPQLYRYNLGVILSNGTETKMGAYGSSRPFFKDWKRLNEDEAGNTLVETAVQGMLDKVTLLDLLENFVLYEEKDGAITKIIAQNHQYLWVNHAFENIKNRKQLDGKLGVFWHTQGSGKSFSMAFLASKVLRKLRGNFTFVVITDRDELDKQIYETFTHTWVNHEKNMRADSVKDLRKLLDEDHRFVFTLIHKFQERELDIHPILNEREDLIVMVDEAHRSQYDQLALNMRNALPNANYIAFTGTPLLEWERVTSEIFGEYVSKYNFKRAVEDHATVPIFYENRKPKLKLTNDTIDEDVAEIYEQFGLNDEDAERFEEEYSQVYQLVTKDERLEIVAEDIVHHYFYQEGDRKAMVVSIDKKTALRMWYKVQKKIEVLKIFLENKLELSESIQEKKDISRILQKIENFDSAVVLSFGDTQQDVKIKEEYGVDMTPHRERAKRDDLENLFKQKVGGLKMVFLCNMWLTGFDAPMVRTLYIDKPMKDHTLMQTIARVNRVASGKFNWLVVDYIWVFKNLQKALAAYASDGTQGVDYPAQDKEALVELVREVIENCKLFLKQTGKVELLELARAQWFDQLRILHKIADKIMRKDLTKKDWKTIANRALLLYKSLLPDERANQFTREINLLKTIASYIENITNTQIDTKGLKEAMRWLLDESIIVQDWDIQTTWLIKDLSQLNANKLQEFFADDSTHIQLERTKELLNKKIDELIVKRPQIATFKKRLEQTMDQYNLNNIDIEKTFEALIALANDLSEEEKAELESGLTAEEFAIFQKIYKEWLSPKEEKEVKKIAHILFEKMIGVKNNFFDWKEKSQGRALMYAIIKESLFDMIPIPAYSEEDAKEKTDEVYDYGFEYL